MISSRSLFFAYGSLTKQRNNSDRFRLMKFESVIHITVQKTSLKHPEYIYIFNSENIRVMEAKRCLGDPNFRYYVGYH